jgi:hypothetical protein
LRNVTKAEKAACGKRCRIRQDSITSKAMPTPIAASSSRLPLSTRTTLPLFIRAKPPFFLARAIVRGKFNSTKLPAFRGVVTGRRTKTPVLLILELLPLKNLFASGSQTLTGQETCVREHLRCSVSVSIPNLLLGSFCLSRIIGSVNLGRLDYLGNLRGFSENLLLFFGGVLARRIL